MVRNGAFWKGSGTNVGVVFRSGWLTAPRHASADELKGPQRLLFWGNWDIPLGNKELPSPGRAASESCLKSWKSVVKVREKNFKIAETFGSRGVASGNFSASGGPEINYTYKLRGSYVLEQSVYESKFQLLWLSSNCVYLNSCILEVRHWCWTWLTLARLNNPECFPSGWGQFSEFASLCCVILIRIQDVGSMKLSRKSSCADKLGFLFTRTKWLSHIVA